MVESECQHYRTWEFLRGDPTKAKGEDGFISSTAVIRRLKFIPDWWQKGFTKTLQAWGSQAHYQQVPELYWIIGVTPDEAKQVLDEGFRQILGCELWTSRCTMPDTSVVRKKGVLAHMTIPVIKSPSTPNFPVIKSPPKSKSCIYLYFIPPPQPSTQHDIVQSNHSNPCKFHQNDPQHDTLSGF